MLQGFFSLSTFKLQYLFLILQRPRRDARELQYSEESFKILLIFLNMNLIECAEKREQVIKKFLIVFSYFSSSQNRGKVRLLMLSVQQENKGINLAKDRDLSSMWYTLNFGLTFLQMFHVLVVWRGQFYFIFISHRSFTFSREFRP